MNDSTAKIIVLGVGGGGNNSVNKMANSNMQGVDFYAVNTDLQTLNKMRNCHTIQIGSKETRGLGAGADPEIGRKAASENKDIIANAINGSDIIFITAGLGGGTGTGAAPVIAQIAQELNILVVSVVTIPFMYEGKKRMDIAREGSKQVQESSDSYVLISNQHLLETTDRNIGIYDSFSIVDQVAQNAVQGVTDLIVQRGTINVDLEDIKTILKKSGHSLIGIGYGKGANRAIEAAQQAITSPLLEIQNIKGASRMLINIAGPEQLSLIEYDKAAAYISNEANIDADIVCGATIDSTLEDQIKVTALISGLANN